MSGGEPAKTLIGSGNGLRLNPKLCSIFSEVFGMKFKLSARKEEAAVGAALYAKNLLGKTVKDNPPV